jgi:predicted Rossmann fold flavoprotein
MEYDVIVIGAGAAGLFAAIEAARRGRSVLVLEHNDRVGRKIAISGGGRCNFTNLYTSAENFISANPNFCKSALARFTPEDFIRRIELHGITYHEKKLGQLFCNEKSSRIIEMLLSECEEAGVRILLSAKVSRIRKHELFQLVVNEDVVNCRALVIATGGLSIPKIGATDFGYRIAKKFNLNVLKPRPGLVPLAYSDGAPDELKALSGVSVDSIATSDGKSFRENTLLTHRGLSGPAILQISSYWKSGESIAINLLPQIDGAALLRNNRNRHDLAAVLSEIIPRRFTTVWASLYAPRKPLSQYSNQDIETVGLLLNQWAIRFDRSEGFGKAEVTIGGVDTNELSSRTMESKKVPGLYFIGEVVDVTGWLGGYNFQWAWASGYAAGQFV